MNTNFRLPRLAAMLLAAQALWAAESLDSWRFWGMADGLAESFSAEIATGPDARVWIRHGRVGNLTIFDGYSTTRVSAPKNLARYFSFLGNGSFAITNDGGSLLEFTAGNWVHHNVTTAGVVAVSSRRVVLTQNDALFEYDLDSRERHMLKQAKNTGLGVFLAICPSSTFQGFWVLGRTGIAKAGLNAFTWAEYPFTALGLEMPEKPVVADDGWIYVVASRKVDGERVLARFDGVGWRIVTQDSGLVRGWEGLNETIWLHRADGLRHISSGRSEVIDRRSVLSGTIQTVVPERGGTIWVGTNQGVARFAPPLWQTPPEAAQIQTGVQSIIEDSQGELWFLSATGILRLDGGRWREYRFPKKWKSIAQATQMVRGPRGTLLVMVMRTGGNALLEFDPKIGAYREIHMPPGHTMQRVLPRDAGSVWICTRVADAQKYVLQVFDGRSLGQALPLPSASGFGVARAVLALPDRDLLIGGSGGFVRYQNGSFQVIGSKDGYTDDACFVLRKLADGSVLAGGRQKLFRSDGRKWQPLQESMDFVRDAIQSRDGAVWVASGSGVHRYMDGVWRTNDDNDGLNSGMAYSVLEDRTGRIWAGTTLGLSEYHQEADRDPPRTILPPAGQPGDRGA